VEISPGLGLEEEEEKLRAQKDFRRPIKGKL